MACRPAALSELRFSSNPQRGEKSPRKTLSIAAALVATAAAGGTLPPEKGVARVAEVPGYTEGAIVDRAGNVYISDVYHGIIWCSVSPGLTGKGGEV